LTKFRFTKLTLRKLDLKRIKLLWQELTFEMVQKKTLHNKSNMYLLYNV